MYCFSISSPVVYVWSGELINDPTNQWQHRTVKHDYDFELMLAREGSFSLVANGTRYTLHKGECLLLPPFVEITGDRTSDHGFIADWLHFLAKGTEVPDNSPEFLHGLQDVITNKTPTTINDSIYLPIKFDIEQSSYIFQLFQQLSTMALKKSYTGRNIDFMTTLLLIELSNDYLTRQARLHISNPSNVEYIAEWIRVHIDKKLTVTKVADQFALNPAYLSRKFSKEYGVGIKSYILEQKIVYACYLLSTSIYSVNEISEKSFFENPKHFMRTFRQHTGVTPTEYRKIYANIHLNSNSVDPRPSIPKEFGTAALHSIIRDIVGHTPITDD